MDDRQFPTNDPQIVSKDRLQAGDGVQGVGTRLAPSSDENENQFGDGNEVLTSCDSAMGRQEKVEQDSINNNENLDSGHYSLSSKEEETGKSFISLHTDIHTEQKPVLEIQTGGIRSPRSKKGSSRKSTGTFQKYVFCFIFNEALVL